MLARKRFASSGTRSVVVDASAMRRGPPTPPYNRPVISALAAGSPQHPSRALLAPLSCPLLGPKGAPFWAP
eukprot:5806470-Pyramimonas_sp.AAC.1